MTQRLVFLLRRRPELTREAFQHYWRTTHAPLVAARAETLGILRYQQVHTVRDGRTVDVPSFDGVAELWTDGAAATGTVEERIAGGRALLEDERNFIDLSASPLWYADEVPLLAGPQEGLRLTAALRRAPGVTREQFAAHWRDSHGPAALADPDVWGFTSYTQLHTPAGADDNPLRAARQAPPAFDGVSEIWLQAPTADAERTAAVRAALLADEPNFMDPAQCPTWLSQVHVIVDRT